MNNALTILKACCKYDYRPREKIFMTPNFRGMPIIGGMLISITLLILIPYFLVSTSSEGSAYSTYNYWILFFLAFWLGAVYVLFCDVMGIYELTKLVKNKTLKKKLNSNIFTV